MGCNCGDNEYNITVNNNGNCEPTTPIYNITLANVGVNGYSPIVRFVNDTVESFNIAVDNVTGTETSPAVPKLSYVADQINDVYNTIAGLSSTYLTRNGNNATLPFSVGNLTLYSNGTTISGSLNASGYIATGEIRPRNSSGITIGYDNYDAPINIVTANKAYYNSNEIATLNDMPTVGNGTIAIMMNGAIRGSFKVNQSNNTILDLGSTSNYTAGNGIDITSNVISVDEDDLSFLKNTATGTANLTILGNPSDEPYTINIGNGSYANYAGSIVIGYNALSNGYNNIAIGIGAKCKYGCDNTIAIGADAYVGDDNNGITNAYQIGTGTNLTSNSLAVGYRDDNLTIHNYQLLDLVTGKISAARIPIDGTTITVNNDGQLQSSGGGSSYTAGTGIDITNDIISVDSTILTTNTAQTVTEDKTFSADIYMDGGDIKLTNHSHIVAKDSSNNYRNLIDRYIDTNQIIIGNNGDVLKFNGNLLRPRYNNADMALLADVPSVGNALITFTQGGVTKGSFYTNQGSNQTIELDAGGSGGGAVDSVNGQTGTVVLTASDVGALPSSTVIPTKTSDLTNDSGYITGITSSDVTTALGYTPYNSTNPDGFITSADLPTNYVTTDTAQTITGLKTFNSIKTDTVYNTNNNPILQIYNSTIRVGNSNYGLKLLGDSTRPEYSMDGGSNYNQLALLSDMPTVNNPTITFTQGGTTKGTITLNQSSNQTIALDAGSIPSVIDGGNA